MHLVGWLPKGVDDVEAARRAGAEGVIARPLSVHCLERPTRPGLLLGYAGTPEREIDRGVEQLARALSAGRRRPETRVRSRA
jgi:GntR family transcriptional regulator/MocR family aminotransferase